MSSPRPIKVLFLDHGPGLGEAISALLSRHSGLHFSGCFSREHELIEQARQHGADVVVVNHDLLVGSGASSSGATRAFIERLQSVAPQARVLMWFERHAVEEAERTPPYGVWAMLERGDPGNRLVDAIRQAAGLIPPSPPTSNGDGHHRSSGGRAIG